jgi:hypothetical protein
MGLPVKLSDDLINLARKEAALSMRSLPGQIEYWARLGQGIERKLTVEQIRLIRTDVEPSNPNASLNEALEAIFAPDAAAKSRDFIFAKSKGQPVYEAVPGRDDVVAQVHVDGTRIIGKIIDRAFVPESP